MTSNIYDVRSSVKRIAWGFFLIHMHFKIGPVDLLADWAGYALIVSVLAFVVGFEEDLKKLRPVGIFLLVWNVISWVGSIFGISGYLSYIAIIPAICNMYFIYKLFSELSDVADRYSCPQVSSLRVWGIANVITTVISTAVSYLALIFSDVDIFMGAGLLMLPVGIIVMLGSMITLFRLSGALKNVPDNSLPEIHIVDDVNPFGDGATL